MKSNIFIIIMIYLSLSMFMYIGGVRVVANDSSEFLGNFIDMDQYENGTLSPTTTFKEVVPSSYEKTGSGGLLSFIDVLGSIKDFLLFMVNIIFAPIGIFIGSGIPPIAAMFIGVPLLIGGVIALIYFIRGGN